jgi:hypothetical protein
LGTFSSKKCNKRGHLQRLMLDDIISLFLEKENSLSVERILGRFDKLSSFIYIYIYIFEN